MRRCVHSPVWYSEGYDEKYGLFHNLFDTALEERKKIITGSASLILNPFAGDVQQNLMKIDLLGVIMRISHHLGTCMMAVFWWKGTELQKYKNYLECNRSTHSKINIGRPHCNNTACREMVSIVTFFLSLLSLRAEWEPSEHTKAMSHN